VESGSCPARTADVSITFSNPATATAMDNFTVCLDQSSLAPIPLTGTIGGGATLGRWERVTGNGSIQSSGAVNGNDLPGPNVNDFYVPVAADFAAGSFTVRLVALDPDGPGGPCVAVNDPVVITKDLLPSPAAAGGNFATCDPNTNLAATAANNGGTGTWTIGNALYYETFPTPDNGLGLFGPNPHALTFTHPANNWSITAPDANT